eukprot:4870825-Pyramimonas_sp.AAC.1
MGRGKGEQQQHERSDHDPHLTSLREFTQIHPNSPKFTRVASGISVAWMDSHLPSVCASGGGSFGILVLLYASCWVYTASPPAIGSQAGYILPPLLRLVLTL